MTLKQVPPKKAKKVILIPKPGLKVLETILEGLKDGSITDAVIVYKKGELDHYVSLTDSSYETLGWMMQKACISMVVEDGDNEEE